MNSVLAVSSLCLLLLLAVRAFPMDQGNAGTEEEVKRGFDPIEVASNFGSFGKRYRYNGSHSRRFNSILSGMLDELRGVDPVSGLQPAKRQFDPIGYGVYGRFG